MLTRHVKKKRKIAPIQQKEKQERNGSYKGVHPSSTKISTHLHILIKIYDLFLFWIRFLTWQNMRSKFAFIPSITTAPPKRSLRSRMERKAQK